MGHDGSGRYSCPMINFPDDDPVNVEARVDAIGLRRFFDQATTTGGSFDAGFTDPTTTAAADILETFVQALDANGNIPTAADLLKGAKNATLKVNVAAPRDSPQRRVRAIP